LEKGDRIVFLFDDFDQINDMSGKGDSIDEGLKAITKEKSSTVGQHLLQNSSYPNWFIIWKT
jgi:hypothetical protein